MQTLTLLSLQTPPFSCYFLPLGYTYFPQHPVVSNYFFLVTRYPTFNVIYNRGQNYSSAGTEKKVSHGDPQSERYGRVQAFIFSEDSGLCDVMLSRWASNRRFILKVQEVPDV